MSRTIEAALCGLLFVFGLVIGRADRATVPDVPVAEAAPPTDEEFADHVTECGEEGPWGC